MRVQVDIQNYNIFLIDFGICLKGLRRVLARAGARFSLFQQVAETIDLGSHFGIILGAESSTIHTLGCILVTLGGPVDTLELRWILGPPLGPPLGAITRGVGG